MLGEDDATIETVKVALEPAQLEAVETLLSTGAFESRGEALHWLITEGLRTIPVDRLSPRIREMLDPEATARKIRRMKETRCGDADAWWQVTRQRSIQAWGPEKPGDVGRGRGLFGDEKMPIGVDYERRVLVTNRGRTEIALDKDHYTLEERDVIRRAVLSFEKSMKRVQHCRRMEDELLQGLLAEAREALDR